MVKSLKLCALLLSAAVMIGCGQKHNGAPYSERITLNTTPEKQDTLPENNPANSSRLVQKAKSAIGTPYVSGGASPGGFDCSGLVKWAYNSVGVNLPRTAREQASVGKKVKNVKDMRAGDIVAFRHPKRGYHTGIYVGEGKFVHSPRKSTRVRINSLSDPYFSSTLLGARRINIGDSENLVAQSDGRFADQVVEKSKLAAGKRKLERLDSISGKRRNRQAKIVAKNETSAQDASLKKKSVIADQASKVLSIHAVTGKSRPSGKNGEAHDQLASASRKASGQREISLLQEKVFTAAPVAKNRKRS